MTKRSRYHKALTIYSKFRKFERKNYEKYFKRISKEEIIRPKKSAKDCYEYYKSIIDSYKSSIDVVGFMDYIEAVRAI